jgi:peptide deformylase
MSRVADKIVMIVQSATKVVAWTTMPRSATKRAHDIVATLRDKALWAVFGVRLRHVTDKTTSHSTRRENDSLQVAGYAQQPIAGAAACNPLPHQTLARTVSGVQKNPRYPDAETVPDTVLINPAITPLGNAMEEGWEGCLSVPGMRGLVPRHAQIRYQGLNEFGDLIDLTVSGFHARVVQHECDHLDGILYPMRIRDMANFGFTEELFPGQELQDE